MKELFADLAPAVPIVEAVEAGTGSGFLIKHDGKHLVVTNRHVIENASKGVQVQFLLSKEGKETRFVIPPEKTKVAAVHKKADLAILDVSAAAQEIAALKVVPVPLAPRGHRAHVGEHVFAIGHPGGSAEELLTRTLSDGIVSAVGRKVGEATFLQVTAPLNPGNSGGPLFDDEGRVLGVNTFGMRRGRNRDLPLEALNFALDVSFVHDLLEAPRDYSLDARDIVALLNPPRVERPPSLIQAANAQEKRYLAAGFQRTNRTAFQLTAGSQRQMTIRCGRGDHAMIAVCVGSDDVDLVVTDANGRVIAKDVEDDAHPEVTFRAGAAGTVFLTVMNPSDREAAVALTLLHRR
jgi:S1-C subfamily serine protease